MKREASELAEGKEQGRGGGVFGGLRITVKCNASACVFHCADIMFTEKLPSTFPSQVMLRALRDFNLGKLTSDDTSIFMGLLNDLFPKTLELVPRAVDSIFEAKVRCGAALESESLASYCCCHLGYPLSESLATTAAVTWATLSLPLPPPLSP